MPSGCSRPAVTSARSSSNTDRIGYVYDAHFGDLAYHLDFAGDGHAMTFSGVGDAKPVADAVVIVDDTAIEIATDVFMVRRKEPDGSTVMHVKDFGRGMRCATIALTDDGFLNYTGTFMNMH